MSQDNRVQFVLQILNTTTYTQSMFKFSEIS